MGLALGLAAAPAGAQAAVITFDDLTCSAWGTLIPNGYAGLNWSNFDCIDGATAWDGNSGYNAGRVSGSHVAYNGGGFPAEFTVTAPGGTKFNFNSVYLTGAWNDDLIVTIVAYREGAAVSTTTHTLSATAPTLVTLNLSQIDRVNMSAAGGTSHGYPTGGGVGWVHFAMDNLDISFNLPPTGVTATAGNAQATVAFTPPPPDAANPVTGYQASCTPQGGGTAVSANGAGSPIVVPGLTNGTLYDCTVTTLYAAGGSVPSAPAAVTPMATVPAAPTGVTATAAPTQASLAFTAPADTGGSPITGYQASCTPQGGGTAVTATGAASPIVVAGLTNGTTYDCTVAAVNAVGTGAASAPVAVTPQAAPVAAVTAVPTLWQWGLMLLGLAAAGLGARRLRRG
ncbi:IPTL-CTERM sorting domain-containing protein [Ottowia beijingensis]|uniref:IPTL-CTERM sorting domain-containing protein n=1 Tax=Ottowia beijingensis TaxID=1207057 RepID=UPI00363C285F